ncbi:MAG: chemotaxis response regulator protein-glutamate methylesterase [Phycisphaerae bacterium]
MLIVDDSALVRSLLTRVLSESSDIEVVGGAKDPYEARELIIEHRPDVIILDIEMPRMDGLTFLKKLQAHYPVPVIMCSGVAPANSQAALTAIELGAVDVVAKPASGGRKAMERLGEDLAEKVRAAAIAMPTRPTIPASATAKPTSLQAAGLDPARFLVAIGASTGGTEAIKELLSHVPADFPPVAIVQHMPEGFTRSFADRLDQFSAMKVTEAVDGDVLIPGRALLARGGTQMSVCASGGRWRIVYGTDELVNRHCPSVDVLFDSVVCHVGKRAVGILLTGMGADGAKGLLNMRNAGAATFAQDQRSCVVYGMPKVAVDLGAVQHSAAPADIPRAVLQALQRSAKTSAQRSGFRP